MASMIEVDAWAGIEVVRIAAGAASAAADLAALKASLFPTATRKNV